MATKDSGLNKLSEGSAPISAPTDGVVPTPIREHQKPELLRLRAQVYSPKLPDFEPYKNPNKGTV